MTTKKLELEWQDPTPTAAKGMEMAGVDYMKAISSGEVPAPPMAVLMNMGPVEIAEGRAVFEGTPGEQHYNPMAQVHGGYASVLLDSAMGCSVHTTLPAGAAYATQTLEIKLVRPIMADTGKVRCEADVVYRGRRQATVEGRLIAVESGKLLAHGTSTCLIIEG